MLLGALWCINLEAPEIIDYIFQFMTDEEEIPHMRQYNQRYYPTVRLQYKMRHGFGKRISQPLIKALHSENSKIRSGIMEALIKLGEKAVDPLITELRPVKIYGLRPVIDALGRIGNATAIGPLKALLSDEREDIRKRAADAIENKLCQK